MYHAASHHSKLSGLLETAAEDYQSTAPSSTGNDTSPPLTPATTTATSSGVSTPYGPGRRNNGGKISSRPSFTGTPLIHSRFDEVMNGLKELSLKDSADRYSHSKLVKTATGVRNLSNQLGQAAIQMDVNAVLIVTKARDNRLVDLTKEMARWIIETYEVTVYVDSQLQKSRRFDGEGFCRTHPHYQGLLRYWTREMLAKEGAEDMVDLVVALGGDGTTLLVGQLFQKIVPPVISFALGSLGFLTNYKIEDYQQHLQQVFDGGIRVNLRMRFACSIYNASGQRKESSPHQVVNDIVIDRGPNPWLSMLELYGDGSLLTVVQADGLILSTPTGSTAYSLSAGGALVHPEIPAMCVTPICPHTLSFRPMLLPDSMHLKVSVPQDSRSTAWVSLDGKTRIELERGDYLTVHASQYPFPTLVSGKTEFIDSVSRSFHWNNTRKQKPFNTESEEGFDIDF